MLRHRVGVALSSTVFVSTIQLIAPTSARAQAWVPPQGYGAVAILYQNQFVDQHTLDDGTRIDRGETRTHIMAIDLTYGLSDRVALNVSLPYIASKYSGANPHAAAQFGQTSVLDVGGYHGTSQDFRADLRYSAVKGATAVTPFVSGLLPSHSYDFFGHGAAGRRIAELQVGVAVGRTFDRLLPGGFVQARYAYAFAQRPLDVRHDRSVADAEVGYFVRPAVRIFALATGQISHGGVRFTPNFPSDLPASQLLDHDRISRINSFNYGGGAQVSLGPAVDLFGSIVHTGYMTNGHVLKYGVTTGLSWSFHHGQAVQRVAQTRERRLIKCLCQKGE
jgi:hypothetical protein